MMWDFELIEENTIDIDSIEELKFTNDIRYWQANAGRMLELAKKQNEILQWAKQADKQIKELKEK